MANQVREELYAVIEKAHAVSHRLSDNPEYGADYLTAIVDAILSRFQVQAYGTTFGSEPVAWAAYGGKTGILRYVETDSEIVDGLRDGSYEIRPLYEVTK